MIRIAPSPGIIRIGADDPRSGPPTSPCNSRSSTRWEPTSECVEAQAKERSAPDSTRIQHLSRQVGQMTGEPLLTFNLSSQATCRQQQGIQVQPQTLGGQRLQQIEVETWGASASSRSMVERIRSLLIRSSP